MRLCPAYRFRVSSAGRAVRGALQDALSVGTQTAFVRANGLAKRSQRSVLRAGAGEIGPGRKRDAVVGG